MRLVGIDGHELTLAVARRIANPMSWQIAEVQLVEKPAIPFADKTFIQKQNHNALKNTGLEFQTRTPPKGRSEVA